jgi:HEPN domain-containing protein
MTPKRKVERTIQEVSKKLKEIETIVNHTNKLKTESGMSRDNYGPRTEKALNKISEKLIKIAERVRAIGE